jgi:uncharacterized protein (TIGR00369 family)
MDHVTEHAPQHAPYSLAEEAEEGIPEGFRRLRNTGTGYFSQLGPVYMRPREDGTAVLGLRVATRHLNTQGVAHGGMLTTLADSALGINVSLARGRRAAQVTVSLTADFLSAAREGQWLEAHVTITRQGQRLFYANCDLMAAGRHVLRSSAVFAAVDRPPREPVQDG